MFPDGPSRCTQGIELWFDTKLGDEYVVYSSWSCKGHTLRRMSKEDTNLRLKYRKVCGAPAHLSTVDKKLQTGHNFKVAFYI